MNRAKPFTDALRVALLGGGGRRLRSIGGMRGYGSTSVEDGKAFRLEPPRPESVAMGSAEA